MQGGGLYAAIEACARRVEASGAQYDGRDVLRCVKRYHRNLLAQLVDALADKELLALCTVAAKRRSRANASPDVEQQLTLAGFERALPSSIKFYDGHKLAFIAVFSAKEWHWLSHIKLQEDNIKACASSIDESRRAIYLIRSTGRDATFGEALALNDAAISTPQR